MSRRRSRASLPAWRRGDGWPAPSEPLPGDLCTYCGRELEMLPVVIVCKNARCKNARFCADCFSVGAGLPPHAPDHDYATAERVETPVFAPGWSASDELKLLDAVATYGPDNWPDVAARMGRNAAKCEAHYRAVYLESETAPLPSDRLLVEAERERKLLEAERERKLADAQRERKMANGKANGKVDSKSVKSCPAPGRTEATPLRRGHKRARDARGRCIRA